MIKSNSNTAPITFYNCGDVVVKQEIKEEDINFVVKMAYFQQQNIISISSLATSAKTNQEWL